MRFLNYLKGRLPSFSLLIFLLSYLLLIYHTTKDSYLFSLWQFSVVILLIVFIDWLIGIIYKKNYPSFLGCILLTGILLFFYGAYIIVPVQKMIILYFQHYIRGRILFVAVYIILLLLLFWVTRKKLIGFRHFNVFSLIFSFSIICSFILSPAKEVKIINTKKNAFEKSGIRETVPGTEIQPKPVLLIIIDAYASPEEVKKKFEISQADELYSFLSNNNWQIKYKFYSSEVNTGLSISSMFNYNLSAPENNYSSFSGVDMARYLINPALMSDLQEQKIEFENYSFFEISKKKPFIAIGDVPNSFTELFFYNSLFFLVKASSAGGINFENISSDYSSVYYYNQSVIDKLIQTLKSQNTAKRFGYFHLIMPHTPYNFGKEFSSNDLKTETYVRYWKFTNTKLLAILKNASPDKYRIIITGDHGHGGEKGNISFDIHNTFAAFYGFEKADVDRINSVQDIGLLINKYLIKTKK